MRTSPKLSKDTIYLKNLIHTGKKNELDYKVNNFRSTGKGFRFLVRRVDYNRIVDSQWKLLSSLNFKEINMKSTTASKKAANLVKYTRSKKGKLYYSSTSKNKLAALIPVYTFVPILCNGKISKSFKSCYLLIVL